VCDFFADFVIPTIPPYSVVVMDNHPMHYGNSGTTLSQILELKNFYIVYLPPYSPDMNPIENCFGTVKYYLKNDPVWFSVDPSTAILNAIKYVMIKLSIGIRCAVIQLFK